MYKFICDDLKVEALCKRLVDHPELFGKYTARRDGYLSPHTEMTDIWVRYNEIAPYLKKGSLQGFNEQHESVWYPVVDDMPEVFDVVFDVMSKVKGERLGGVLITKLSPDGQILPHTDAGWHAEYYEKYYVPIQNDAGCIFGFESGDLIATPGQCWKFNNSKLHWVKNNSKRDRIAMVVCIKTREGI